MAPVLPRVARHAAELRSASSARNVSGLRPARSTAAHPRSRDACCRLASCAGRSTGSVRPRHTLIHAFDDLSRYSHAADANLARPDLLEAFDDRLSVHMCTGWCVRQGNQHWALGRSHRHSGMAALSGLSDPAMASRPRSASIAARVRSSIASSAVANSPAGAAAMRAPLHAQGPRRNSRSLCAYCPPNQAPGFGRRD